jgi:5'-methylthioadenosine phosphorylase
MVKIGIIGGTGLENTNLLHEAQEVTETTPYGFPSSPLTIGKIGNANIVVVARHGKQHNINPTKVNYRANIHALKSQGCTHILSITAVGSLKNEIKPGHLVFPDQFIDRTTKREQTFYDKDKVCHIPMAEPFCAKLRKQLSETSKELDLEHHEKATIITIEGPRFSTKAESHLFRSWNADLINMSTVPEVILAREAGICYGLIAMSTDYDCWNGSESVNVAMVMETMKRNAENVKKLILAAIPKIIEQPCMCKESIKGAFV